MRRQVDSGGEHWTGRVNFRHPTLPLVLEVQSEMYHQALRDTVRDAVRLAQLDADGFTVVEVADGDVFVRPWVVREKVRSAIADLQRGNVVQYGRPGGQTAPQNGP